MFKKMQLKHNLHFQVCVDVCSCFGEIIDSFFSLSWHVYSLVFRANCLFFLYLRINRANIMLSTLYCNVKLVVPNIVLTARLNYNKKNKNKKPKKLLIHVVDCYYSFTSFGQPLLPFSSHLINKRSQRTTLAELPLI